ncbi:hypothetical protein HBO97_24365, partial [Pseudomonas lundensis]|nr:hypothetical protein [Pseudomonas lundensis]
MVTNNLGVKLVAKIRVYELAKKLNISSKELIAQ